MAIKLAVLSITAALTCAAALGTAPAGTLGPFTAPTMWAEEYAKAERCAGVKGDVAQVEWHLVPGRYFRSIRHPKSKLPAIGEWLPPHRIYIAADWATTGWVIRHEAMHDITGLLHPEIDTLLQRCHVTWGWLAGGEDD